MKMSFFIDKVVNLTEGKLRRKVYFANKSALEAILLFRIFAIKRKRIHVKYSSTSIHKESLC
jgi:hypothetical protein